METAYKAVMKPKEGTILTVAREAALIRQQRLAAEADDTAAVLCRELLHMQRKFWPGLPRCFRFLKEAGVVDSGGQGLLEVLKRCLSTVSLARKLIIPISRELQVRQ